MISCFSWDKKQLVKRALLSARQVCQQWKHSGFHCFCLSTVNLARLRSRRHRGFVPPQAPSDVTVQAPSVSYEQQSCVSCWTVSSRHFKATLISVLQSVSAGSCLQWRWSIRTAWSDSNCLPSFYLRDRYCCQILVSSIKHKVNYSVSSRPDPHQLEPE